jgi:ADP-ribose pyrophosphatase YjhB (NUDIX family)
MIFTHYVLGFMFDQARLNVVMIRKRRPEWQAGHLNGVGGKVNNIEIPESAMAREWREETGSDFGLWQRYAQLIIGENVAVSCYRAFNSAAFYEARSMTDEEIVKVSVNAVQSMKVISNCNWLIPLALDRGTLPDSGSIGPNMVLAHYES